MDALDHMFFVGLQEAYDLSVEVMLRELGSKVKPKVKKERQDVSKKLARNKVAVTSNTTLMDKAAAVNSFDIRLYEKGGLLCHCFPSLFPCCCFCSYLCVNSFSFFLSCSP